MREHLFVSDEPLFKLSTHGSAAYCWHCNRCFTQLDMSGGVPAYCTECGYPLLGTLNPLRSPATGLSLYSNASVYVNGVLLQEGTAVEVQGPL